MADRSKKDAEAELKSLLAQKERAKDASEKQGIRVKIRRVQRELGIFVPVSERTKKATTKATVKKTATTKTKAPAKKAPAKSTAKAKTQKAAAKAAA